MRSAATIRIVNDAHDSASKSGFPDRGDAESSYRMSRRSLDVPSAAAFSLIFPGVVKRGREPAASLLPLI